MKQIDYIKIKQTGVENLQKEFLTPHPAIKNRYKISSAKTRFNGNTLFGHNIDIYHHHNTLYLSCSLPYLVHGHNFVDFPPTKAEEILEYLSTLLKVDLLEAELVAFEIGIISRCKTSFKGLCNEISGVDDMELQKKDSGCLFYGKHKKQLKIYDIAKNIRSKIEDTVKPTFDWDLVEKSIKTELKFKNDRRYSVAHFISEGFDENIDQLKAILYGRIHLSDLTYSGEKFDDILFKTLLKTNKYTPKGVREMVLDEINKSEMTPAKKSMRRQALQRKLKQVQVNNKRRFADLFENVAQPQPLVGPSKK